MISVFCFLYLLKALQRDGGPLDYTVSICNWSPAPVSVLSSIHYLVSLVSDRYLVHLILSGCRPGCSSWPLPLPTPSRRLASILLHAIADHPLMLLTQCPVHPPRALISLECAPPNTGPEPSPTAAPLACITSQSGNTAPFLVQHFQWNSQRRGPQSQMNGSFHFVTQSPPCRNVSHTDWG